MPTAQPLRSRDGDVLRSALRTLDAHTRTEAVAAARRRGELL